MPKNVLKVENISKLYRLGEVGTGTISHDLNRWWSRMRGKEDPYEVVGQVNDRTSKRQNGAEYVWALNDIEFEVKQGEVLGIIGKNGAGKSTLLKILSKITAPTSGRFKTRGRIASLLEVGTGMHPEMTGLENVYLNGTILGMTRAEIKAKLDDILDFAGCAKYADTPVKRYSSGMKVRLGFAVAAFLEPEILIVDEVLAVGDAEFQKRAIGKMQDISKGGGRTVLFVSHNMASVSALCSRAIMLKNGKLAINGDTDDVIHSYISSNKELATVPISERKDRKGVGLVKIKDVSIYDVDNKPIVNIMSGQTVRFKIDFINDTNDTLKNLRFDVGLNNSRDDRISWFSTTVASKTLNVIPKEVNTFYFVLERFPFMPDRYSMAFNLMVGNDLMDWIPNALYFEVVPGDYFKTGKLLQSGQGSFLVDHRFELN